MTVSGFLSTSPVVEGSMASEVAKAIEALDDYDVRYETTAMGTLIETDDVGELFAAAEAAHAAIDADRVSTTLKIDDKRTSDEPMEGKVEAVEAELGREATNR